MYVRARLSLPPLMTGYLPLSHCLLLAVFFHSFSFADFSRVVHGRVPTLSVPKLETGYTKDAKWGYMKKIGHTNPMMLFSSLLLNGSEARR